MVKANAYGVGAVPVVRALEPLDPWGFGVATIPEGKELRAAGVIRTVLIFTPLLADDLPAACAARLTPALSSASSIRRWRELGGGAWHLAVDTGMSRAGVRWDAVAALAAAMRETPPAGVFTHFHSAELDDGSREEQERRFRAVIEQLPARPAYLHAENSAGITHHDRSSWDLVRPGVFLYGVGSGSGTRVRPEPVVRLHARVVDVRTVHAGDTVSYDAAYRVDGDRRIATLAIGYADGYRRALGNRGSALLHGRLVPVVGLVTMDMTMLDVTDVACEVGDVATLIGGDGADALDVERVARAADVSPYELLTGLGGRLDHVYITPP
jgi:alanine racemase